MRLSNEQIAQDIEDCVCKYANREGIDWQNLPVSMADCIAPSFVLTNSQGNPYKVKDFIADVKSGAFEFNRYKRAVLSMGNDEVYIMVSFITKEPAWQRIAKALSNYSNCVV